MCGVQSGVNDKNTSTCCLWVHMGAPNGFSKEVLLLFGE